MAVDVAEVKKLREATGVGLTDAKRALEEAGGDYAKALENMRIKGLARADKKADRPTGAGLVHAYVHGGKIGVLIELNCETDFVARTDDFKALANDLALQVAASAPLYLSAEAVPAEALAHERKLIEAELKAQGKPAAVAEKIVEGKLDKFYSQTCLLQQPFIKDPDLTVGDLVKQTVARLGENVVVRRFTRLVLGEQAD
jgi:elongation factor Ts